MADVSLDELYRRILKNPDGPATLIERAAAVANAIHVGVGAMIKDSMMEQDLRDALCLRYGELVNIPKPTSAGEKHGAD